MRTVAIGKIVMYDEMQSCNANKSRGTFTLGLAYSSVGLVIGTLLLYTTPEGPRGH